MRTRILVAAIGLTALFLLSVSASSLVERQGGSTQARSPPLQPDNRPGLDQAIERPPPLPKDAFGEPVRAPPIVGPALRPVIPRVGEFPVLVPSSLPEGIKLENISTKGANQIIFFYSKGLTIIETTVDYPVKLDPEQIAEAMIKANAESTNKYKPKLQPFAYQDAYGVGADPWFYVSWEGITVQRPGELNFWRNDSQRNVTIHYDLIGPNLTFAQLRDIAISMLQP